MQKGMLKIDELCKKYNSRMEGKGFFFNSEDAGKYSACAIHRRDFEAKKDLISGKLIFDRFGDIKQEQINIVKFCNINLYSNLSNIENIDEVKQQIKK